MSPMLPPRPDFFGSVRQAACWLPARSIAVAIHSSGYSACTTLTFPMTPAATMARASWTMG